MPGPLPGWGLVALDECGRVQACGFGVPPAWCRGIHGAGLWALYAALRLSPPGAIFRSDRKAVVDKFLGGCAATTAADVEHARLWEMVFSVCDDGAFPELVWLPSHTTDADVGRRL